MKRICILLIMIGLVALGANAQTVTGSGTMGFVPQFTSTSTIGNSNIFQSSNGNIGIGWPTPQYPLQIFTNDLPGALYVQAQASVNNVCAICPVNAILALLAPTAAML